MQAQVKFHQEFLSKFNICFRRLVFLFGKLYIAVVQKFRHDASNLGTKLLSTCYSNFWFIPPLSFPSFNHPPRHVPLWFIIVCLVFYSDKFVIFPIQTRRELQLVCHYVRGTLTSKRSLERIHQTPIYVREICRLWSEKQLCYDSETLDNWDDYEMSCQLLCVKINNKNLLTYVILFFWSISVSPHFHSFSWFY